MGASKIVSPLERGDRVDTDQSPLLQPLGPWFRHSPGLKILKNLLLPTPPPPPTVTEASLDPTQGLLGAGHCTMDSAFGSTLSPSRLPPS